MAQKLNKILILVYKKVLILIILLSSPLINMARQEFKKRPSDDADNNCGIVRKLEHGLESYDQKLLGLSNNTLSNKEKEEFLDYLNASGLDPNKEIEELQYYLKNQTQIDNDFIRNKEKYKKMLTKVL